MSRYAPKTFWTLTFHDKREYFETRQKATETFIQRMALADVEPV